MTGSGQNAPDLFADAMLAVRLLRIDPGLGGIVLRGDGAAQDAVVAALCEGAVVRRVPRNVDLDRLVGGLDLGATLAAGRPIAQRGLLAEANGGMLVMPGAERADDMVVSQLCAAIDSGMVVVERDGVALRDAARFAVVALDDGIEDERIATGLAERLAFRFDLSGIAPHAFRIPDVPPHGEVAVDDEQLHAIAATAAALGVESARGALLTLRAAKAIAALGGWDAVSDLDIATAARLVLGPRATRMPAPESEAPPDSEPPPPPEDNPGDQGDGEVRRLDDMVLEAALASLPRDVLAAIAAGQGRGPISRARGKGAKRKSPTRGRAIGVRAGLPRGGLRLSLIDTLRAAAPWQRLRGRDDSRIRVRRDDLRIRRFETRAEATTIFAVDASGSSAVARLAEAKGAVELLLAEAYVKRAQVALVAFRGEGAEILLPPTRSLARAKRALAELPGGGGTPIAAGLAAAHDLAIAAAAKGRTPFVVVLSDGRANIALDGGTDRAAAAGDAEAAAKAIGESGIAGAFVDISPRPRAEGERLAAAMGARYLALPRADAGTMHAAVRAVAPK
ncbi:magnesium chelatase subunit D [Sphingomonas qomolangmaensis]|uniref:Magnesium chelatase subunit D n=1 Tax=Sphingomonas qomolangmaensis TaxID=2918765 RepID=A0ABY5LA73_9SPHN|nr:magnesium chelatase subunit D [Sphingomonas qomolangmaensis]UUL83046.1 magnesium chelatase subunit D [Sphingomonas qomolangmaensis]